MKTLSSLKPSTLTGSLFGIGLLTATFFLGCATSTYKGANVLDRSKGLEVVAGVPANVSEIREVTFHSIGDEKGHKDVHIRGQLYVKSNVSGSVQLKPCSSCDISLRNTVDTVNRGNLRTENDGYFEFNAALPFNQIIIKSPGNNELQIDNVNLTHQGITTMKLIVAAGTGKERFTLSKTGDQFTWAKVQ